MKPGNRRIYRETDGEGAVSRVVVTVANRTKTPALLCSLGREVTHFIGIDVEASSCTRVADRHCRGVLLSIARASNPHDARHRLVVGRCIVAGLRRARSPGRQQRRLNSVDDPLDVVLRHPGPERQPNEPLAQLRPSE